jgi:hypothetical protein
MAKQRISKQLLLFENLTDASTKKLNQLVNSNVSCSLRKEVLITNFLTALERGQYSLEGLSEEKPSKKALKRTSSFSEQYSEKPSSSSEKRPALYKQKKHRKDWDLEDVEDMEDEDEWDEMDLEIERKLAKTKQELDEKLTKGKGESESSSEEDSESSNEESDGEDSEKSDSDEELKELKEVPEEEKEKIANSNSIIEVQIPGIRLTLHSSTENSSTTLTNSAEKPFVEEEKSNSNPNRNPRKPKRKRSNSNLDQLEPEKEKKPSSDWKRVNLSSGSRKNSDESDSESDNYFSDEEDKGKQQQKTSTKKLRFQEGNYEKIIRSLQQSSEEEEEDEDEDEDVNMQLIQEKMGHDQEELVEIGEDDLGIWDQNKNQNLLDIPIHVFDTDNFPEYLNNQKVHLIPIYTKENNLESKEDHQDNSQEINYTLEELEPLETIDSSQETQETQENQKLQPTNELMTEKMEEVSEKVMFHQVSFSTERLCLAQNS